MQGLTLLRKQRTGVEPKVRGSNLPHHYTVINKDSQPIDLFELSQKNRSLAPHNDRIAPLLGSLFIESIVARANIFIPLWIHIDCRDLPSGYRSRNYYHNQAKYIRR
jgi:hypothetical protein